MCVHGISAFAIYVRGSWIQSHQISDSMQRPTCLSLCILPGSCSMVVQWLMQRHTLITINNSDVNYICLHFPHNKGIFFAKVMTADRVGFATSPCFLSLPYLYFYEFQCTWQFLFTFHFDRRNVTADKHHRLCSQYTVFFHCYLRL